jgi:hypothetical protein
MSKTGYSKAHRPILSLFREPEFRALEAWRRSQDMIPNMSEAVRTLVSLGLKLPSSKDTSA